MHAELPTSQLIANRHMKVFTLKQFQLFQTSPLRTILMTLRKISWRDSNDFFPYFVTYVYINKCISLSWGLSLSQKRNPSISTYTICNFRHLLWWKTFFVILKIWAKTKKKPCLKVCVQIRPKPIGNIFTPFAVDVCYIRLRLVSMWQL